MVYVHIPFCRSFCSYCGFYSEIPGQAGNDDEREDGNLTHGTEQIGKDEKEGTNVIPGLTGNLTREAEREDRQERVTVGDFVEALCREAALRADEIRSCHGTETLYIGGGTPSILSLEQLERIVLAVRKALGNEGADVSGSGSTDGSRSPGTISSLGGSGSPFREFTVEVNPDDIVRKGPEYVKGLMRLGVNRVSMGVQSFDDRVLHRMNRRHSAADAVKAYRILRECGVENISIDLIFGFPPDFGNGSPSGKDLGNGVPEMQEEYGTDGRGGRTDGDGGRTDGDGGRTGGDEGRTGGDEGDGCAEKMSEPLDYWRDTLRRALEIGGDGRPPEHISAYQLSIEKGSALEKMVADGRFTPLSDELCSAQYDLLCSTLAAAGYNHYEISNFARPGKEAIHNSAYWNHTPYVGLGPGAHSLVFRESYPADSPGPAGKTLGQGRPDDLVKVHQAEETAAEKFGQGDDAQKRLVARRWNIDDVRAYINAYSTPPAPLSRENPDNTDGNTPPVTGEEILTAEQIHTEQIMLCLRTSRGIPRHILESIPASAARVRRLIACGSLVPVSEICKEDSSRGDLPGRPDRPAQDAPRLRIPENRFFVSDDIIAELI